METLKEEDKAKVMYSPSKRFFRFGDSRLYESQGSVRIPANIEGKKFFINADIVNAEIPLLLSKDAMKKANVIINLKNDEVKMFGKKVKVFLTRRGHYCVALNNKVNLSRLDSVKPHQVSITNIEKLDTLK